MKYNASYLIYMLRMRFNARVMYNNISCCNNIEISTESAFMHIFFNKVVKDNVDDCERVSCDIYMRLDTLDGNNDDKFLINRHYSKSELLSCCSRFFEKLSLNVM